jgi:antirestriction protein ArdC
MKKPTAARPNVYQIVTDRILESLKSGIIPWEKPWTSTTYAGGNLPRNFRTGKPYRGVNVFLLWSSPYSSPFWLTFKQALDLKGNVGKGEKGTQIVFYKQLHKGNAKENTRTGEPGRDPEASERAPFVLTYHTVFNVEQCENLQIPASEPMMEATEIEEDATCEAIVNAWEGRPALHLVGAHELYSKEELVAETGAAFLSAIAGIANNHTERNTTAYLQNWITRLEADNRLIVQAAAHAQKAVDLITGYTFAPEQEEGSASGTPEAIAL